MSTFLIRIVRKRIFFIRLTEKIAAYQKFIGTEPLDLVKFICKEFWEEVFKKKVSVINFLLFFYIR